MASGEQIVAVVEVNGTLWALRSRPGVSTSCVPIKADEVHRMNNRAQLLHNSRRCARTTIVAPIPTFTIPAGDTGRITEETG